MKTLEEIEQEVRELMNERDALARARTALADQLRDTTKDYFAVQKRIEHLVATARKEAKENPR